MFRCIKIILGFPFRLYGRCSIRYAFGDSAWGILFNPFYLTRRALWRAVAEYAPNLSGRLLDVGCGTKPYESLFDCKEYVGLEYSAAGGALQGKADVLYQGGRFPFADESFDAVLCNQVLEHVFEPDAFCKEIARVLKPDGRLLLTVPFCWPEHECPLDYARYSSYGLCKLLEGNGLVELRNFRTCADLSAMAQLFNDYICSHLEMKYDHLRIILMFVFTVPVTLLGLLAGKVMPGNKTFYLDNIVLACKKQEYNVNESN